MRISTRGLVLAAILSGAMAVPALGQTSAQSGSTATAPAKSTPSKAQTEQQQRMVKCNADAKGKKGDERKTFMSSCLKGETAANGKALTSSQQRMKDCNAQAATQNLSGDKRKTFMSTCLKAK